MKVEWIEQEIPGVLVSKPSQCVDQRGTFRKLFGDAEPFGTHEVCVSISSKDVLRGMHYQAPPRAQEKFIFVQRGAISDLVLDLRVGSPTEGRLLVTELTPDGGGIRIPVGCAHGFESLEKETIVCYLLGQGYSSEFDFGINLASIGYEPLTTTPIVSERDQGFPLLHEFVSPFHFASEV